MACNDVLRQVAPSRNGSLALLAVDSHSPLVRLLSIDIDLDIQNDDRAQETHALFRDSQQFRAILVEFDSLDGGIEVPDLEAFARPDVP